MKINFINPVFWLLISVCLLSSCIRDGMNPCPTYTKVKVIVASGKNAEISVIDLYVFRLDGSLVEKISNVNLDEWIGLDYPEEGGLEVVAIANSSVYDEVICNNHLNESSIVLKPSHEFDSKLLYNAPGDVFRGNVTVTNRPLFLEEKEIIIYPIVSKMNIKFNGHRQYAKQVLDLIGLPVQRDFTFVVGTRHISIDFMGIPCGSPVYYHGKNVIYNEWTCEVETFNMFSTEAGEEVAIYVYHGATLIDTITEAEFQTKSTTKSVLTAHNGKLLEVYINYESGINIALQNTNWLDGGLLWKDF